MRTKLLILFLLLAILAAAIAFYWAEHRKLEEVDARVRAWQTRMSEYISFDYGAISTRLGPNTVTLEEVYVTYPFLMSIDKLSVTIQAIAKIEESINPPQKKIRRLFISAQGLNFTLPNTTENMPWHGNVAVDYQYNAPAKQMDIFLQADFPQFINGELQATLLNIVPDVDIVFTYPDVLLASLEIELQDQGLLQKMGHGHVSNHKLLDFLNKLSNNEQRQVVAEFWSTHTPMVISFYPEYPLPLYRIIDNSQLFWQHPSVNLNTKIKLL